MSPRYAENYRAPWQRGLHHYGGTAVRGLTRKGPRLPFADRALFWWRADDGDAVLSSAGDFVSAPNRGSLGGTVTPGLNTGPKLVRLANGRLAANPTTNGGLSFGTTSSFSSLHDPSGDALVAIRLRVDGATGGIVVGNKSFAGTERGFRLLTTAVDASTVRFALNVSNGASNVVGLGAPATNATLGSSLTLLLRKTALTYEMFFGATLVASGTAASLTPGAASSVLAIGSYNDDTTTFPGLINEVAVLAGTFSNADIATLSSYFSAEWTEAYSHPRYAACVLHFQADHPSTTIAYGASSTFAAAPNLGSLGGSLLPGTGLGPERIQIAGRFAALTTTLGSLMFGTTSSLTMLHDLGTSATLALHVRVDVAIPAANKRLFATRGVAATSRGIIVYHLTSGALQISVSDGTSNVVTINGAAITTGLHSIIVTKSAMVYTAYLDGSVYGSATAATLTTGTSDAVASIGSTTADTTNFDGAILEGSVLSGVALSAGEVTQEHNYLVARAA